MVRSPAGRFGYRQDDIVVLTDDSRNPRQVPTRANIVLPSCVLLSQDLLVFADCSYALAGTRCPSPRLVVLPLYTPLFSFGISQCLISSADSGHGGQTKDLDGDEADGFDEGSRVFYYRPVQNV